jgi:MFS family permease
MTCAIPTRILWGYVAASWVGSSAMLGILAIGMAVGTVLTGFYSPEWTDWQLVAVSVVVTSTALGWQGVLLSEVARLSPPGQVGAATGGVLSFSSLGQVVMPLLFSGVLALTGSYSLGFYVTAIPAFLVGVMLFHGGVDGRPVPKPA